MRKILKIIGFLLILSPIVLAAYWLFQHPGQVSINWVGYSLSMPIAMAVIAFSILIIAFWFVAKIILWVLNIPFKIGQNWSLYKTKKQKKAFMDLVVAVHMEDKKQVGKLLQKLDSFKSDALTKFYIGMGYRLLKDHLRAERSFTEIAADFPLLSMRGMYEDLIMRGNKQAGLDVLGQITNLSPGSPWALREMERLADEIGRFETAENAITRLKDLGYLNQDSAKKRMAKIFANRAMHPGITIREKEEFLRKSHYLDSSIADVTKIFAVMMEEEGHHSYALSAIEATWKYSPNLDLGEVYIRLAKPESMLDAYNLASSLAKANPNAYESKMLCARYAIKAKLWGNARKLLTDILKNSPTSVAYGHMAELEMKETGDIKLAHEWAMKGCK